MKKLKYFLILIAISILLLNTGCNFNLPECVKNVRYLRQTSGSSYAVLIWDSVEGADKYTIYKKESYSDVITEYATTKNCVYGLESNERLYAYESWSFAVEATISGNKTYCSDFVTLEKSKTYADIQN